MQFFRASRHGAHSRLTIRIAALAALGGLVLAALAAWTTLARAQVFESQAPHAFLYDVETRSVLYQKSADAPFPPASLVKLMTAEVLFREMAAGKITMETEFPISENAWRRGGAPSGGSSMFAAVGSRVRVQDLISGLIVHSGNDAALAIAEGVAGTEAAFMGLVQQRATALGLTRSRFRNATGFSDPEQRVTAREMALLADHVIRSYPEQYALFGQKEFTWNRVKQVNRNPLVAVDIGADGVKTGNIAESGFSLIGSSVQGGRRLIVVVLGLPSARDRAIEARRLLDWGFRTFEKKTLINGGELLGEAVVHGGARATVGLKVTQAVELLVPKGAPELMRARISYSAPLSAPVSEGNDVGRLRIYRGDILVTEVPVVAAATVEKGTLWQRAKDSAGALAAQLVRRVRGS
jgi:serine-type D-Ala-D-Ala carboxypeptidase (penicillin-binding protein 5/6)